MSAEAHETRQTMQSYCLWHKDTANVPHRLLIDQKV
jgi:hypothetical protein